MIYLYFGELIYQNNIALAFWTWYMKQRKWQEIVTLWFISTYLVFVHNFWLTASKTLGISLVLRIISLVLRKLSYVNAVAFRKYLEMAAGGQWNQPWWQGWTASPNSWPPGKGEGKGLEVESIHNGKWFHQSWQCKEACTKTSRLGFTEVPGWWTPGGSGRVPALGGDGSSGCPALCISSFWLFLL